jgi:MYXO-CTERM domain-containing protein
VFNGRVKGWMAGREWLGDALYAAGYFTVGVLLHLIVPEVAIRWSDGPVPSTWAVLGLLVVAALGHTQRRVRPVLGLVIGCVALLGAVQLGYLPLALMLVLGELLYCSVLYTSQRLSWAVTDHHNTAEAMLRAAGFADHPNGLVRRPPPRG